LPKGISIRIKRRQLIFLFLEIRTKKKTQEKKSNLALFDDEAVISPLQGNAFEQGQERKLEHVSLSSPADPRRHP